MADNELEGAGSERESATQADLSLRTLIARMQSPENVAVGRSLFDMTNEELRRRLRQPDGEPMVPPKS